MSVTINLDRDASIQVQLHLHRQRLHWLERQQAEFGDVVPRYIVNEITVVREQIAQLESMSVEVFEQVLLAWQVEEVFDDTFSKASSISPPNIATYLLYFLPMSKETREAILGDLEEEFCTISKRFGERKAVAWYWYQVGVSFWPFAVRAGRKLLKWGVLGWVGEAVRRFIS